MCDVILVGTDKEVEQEEIYNYCLPRRKSRQIFVGEPGAGKTVLADTILRRSPVDDLFVIAQHIDDPQYKQLYKEFVTDAGTPGIWSDSMTDLPDNKQLKKGNYNYLRVDDMQMIGRAKAALGKLVAYYVANRHADVTIQFLVQNVMKAPPEVRELSDHWFLFAGIGIDDLKEVFKCAIQGEVTFDQFVTLYRESTHNWLVNHGCLAIFKKYPRKSGRLRYKLGSPFKGFLSSSEQAEDDGYQSWVEELEDQYIKELEAEERKKSRKKGKEKARREEEDFDEDGPSEASHRSHVRVRSSSRI
jgi:hypothetical protein